MRFLLLAIPILAIAIAVSRVKPLQLGPTADLYQALYRLGPSDPDKWTPGQPQFDLGQVVMTPGVQNLLTGEDDMQRLSNIITHHREGDWGDVDPEDQATNDEAVELGERILGSHRLGGKKIWVITEWDRSVTTALLPEEY